VVMQETESNLIVFHNEFSFEMRNSKEYYQTILTNYDFLKYVFYGAFFSRVIFKLPFDVAFQVALETYRKMLEILQANEEIPDNQDYFLVLKKKKDKPDNLSNLMSSSMKLKNSQQFYGKQSDSYISPTKNPKNVLTNSLPPNTQDLIKKQSYDNQLSLNAMNNPNRAMEVEQKKAFYNSRSKSKNPR